MLDARGPLRAVLNKQYQSNCESMLSKCFDSNFVERLASSLLTSLFYPHFHSSLEILDRLKHYLHQLSQLWFQCEISEPRF